MRNRLIAYLLLVGLFPHPVLADTLGTKSAAVNLNGTNFGFQYTVTQSGAGGHVYFTLSVTTPISQTGQTVDATQPQHWTYFDTGALGAIFSPLLQPHLVVTVGTPGLVCPYTDHIVKNNYEIIVNLELRAIGNVIHPVASYQGIIRTEDFYPQPGKCPWSGWYIPNPSDGYMRPNP